MNSKKNKLLHYFLFSLEWIAAIILAFIISLFFLAFWGFLGAQ